MIEYENGISYKATLDGTRFCVIDHTKREIRPLDGFYPPHAFFHDTKRTAKALDYTLDLSKCTTTHPKYRHIYHISSHIKQREYEYIVMLDEIMDNISDDEVDAKLEIAGVDYMQLSNLQRYRKYFELFLVKNLQDSSK